MSAAQPTREEWRALKARRDALPEMTRRLLARHWTNAAQLEHASVAAFSRFSLQLLAVGAPPLLVEQAHGAALDEIKHAELCFSLATVYAGHAIGPGPLPVDERALRTWDLTSSAVGTVEEGCVGESIAALEAQVAAELAQDEAVRSVLLRVHADESRHAELAFRFVAWAVETGGAEVTSALRAAFERLFALHGAHRPPASIADAELEPHGVLGAARKRALRARILTEIVRPSVARLLG